MKIIAAAFLAVSLVGCSGAAPSDSRTLTFGDTTFNSENDERDINPHNGYSGWACIRYGVGETLFRFNDDMQIEPWLAESYKHPDSLTWQIHLRDGIRFSSGRAMDAESVKECLDDLIQTNERAAGDLKIAGITAQGQDLVITTGEPFPALLSFLADPYSCIIDMDAGTDQGIVSGTGPYVCTELKADQGLTLVRNENYWNGNPQLDTIQVKTITDGDTLTMALQSGEIDAAYGLPYSSLSLFQSDDYSISSCTTSRTFFTQMNLKNSILQDDRVRAAICSAIDKQNFARVLMSGQGEAAEGPFPAGMSGGDDTVHDEAYDPDHARQLLAQAGWTDSDGDGYVDQSGQKLALTWLTYPSRQELPLLAENAQEALRNIGIDLTINSTAAWKDELNKGNWDLFTSAFVTAPTGDPEYFFLTHCLDSSSANRGGYHSDQLEQLASQLHVTDSTAERAQIASKMVQTILDDHAFLFIAHLKMSIVSHADVKGLDAHPCDYYEFTADTEKAS